MYEKPWFKGQRVVILGHARNGYANHLQHGVIEAMGRKWATVKADVSFYSGRFDYTDKEGRGNFGETRLAGNDSGYGSPLVFPADEFDRWSCFQKHVKEVEALRWGHGLVAPGSIEGLRALCQKYTDIAASLDADLLALGGGE